MNHLKLNMQYKSKFQSTTTNQREPSIGQRHLHNSIKLERRAIPQGPLPHDHLFIVIWRHCFAVDCGLGVIGDNTIECVVIVLRGLGLGVFKIGRGG